MGEAVTFGLTTLGRMALCTLTFRIMLLGIINLFNNAQQIITTLCLMRLNRMTVSIMSFRIIILSIMTLRISAVCII